MMSVSSHMYLLPADSIFHYLIVQKEMLSQELHVACISETHFKHAKYFHQKFHPTKSHSLSTYYGKGTMREIQKRTINVHVLRVDNIITKSELHK